jgi:hypothetical protein
MKDKDGGMSIDQRLLPSEVSRPSIQEEIYKFFLSLQPFGMVWSLSFRIGSVLLIIDVICLNSQMYQRYDYVCISRLPQNLDTILGKCVAGRPRFQNFEYKTVTKIRFDVIAVSPEWNELQGEFYC